ncbi:hypothetical protein TBLA_0B07850 [Henningerozyma blattae CBS 6284]|uniref:Uncharacterized protein n=1 Tax=Henningerozyma blattae (strain ATCC 34711 / CBS 6284 / DSM 70876 / NBRC 10599 / NRRL Y-10934 / UCD 77-7) TaxID=1071380 RepID=I2GZP9_HENB6|nr:hypothetical protein TBLA_0B07850 [Tetrapisispora blattae CBS 6284]CCH59601.1 hypothetical protein TBLA_0B07850 [Tetrapisispora blattae CBS 6284]
MLEEDELLPLWLKHICILSCILGFIISMYSITMQLLNYRKPFEQRLTIRIQVMVPIFCVSSSCAVFQPTISQIFIDPIREVYEAFIIYTFFSLMVLLLNGEREIITKLSLKHRPLSHPIFFFGRFFKKIDLSDPGDFLWVKFGILQYVWFKPFYCVSLITYHFFKWKYLNIIMVVMYNVSMTWSLYNLALFWICLSDELKPFDPWKKFLCVKLIIFASYWQSLIVELISYCNLGNLPTNSDKELWSYVYQNCFICLEMIGFAIFHLLAFPWEPYSVKNIPHGAKMRFWYSLRDCFGIKDLIWDFNQTLVDRSNYYNYKTFDPTETDTAINETFDSQSLIRQSKKGIRYNNTDNKKYWVGINTGPNTNYGTIGTPAEPSSMHNIDLQQQINDNDWDISIPLNKYIPTDINYPVYWSLNGHRYSDGMNLLRESLQSV